MIKKTIVGTQHPWVRLQRALKPYEEHWYEWLQSDTCFLSGMDERIVGYLFAFKGDIFCASRILELSEKEYLSQLNRLIGRLEGSQPVYLLWLKKASYQIDRIVGGNKN